MKHHISLPSVMVFAGLDPTGGAGIQADIEAIASMGCHATPVLTAVTVQNTSNLIEFIPQCADLITRQANAVLDDIPVAAFKLGFLGRAEIAEAVHIILAANRNIPVVLDPVICSGGGKLMADDNLIHIIRTQLLSLATLVTPNSHEARTLAFGADTLDDCAMAILDYGVDNVLITGTHEATKEVTNTLYGNNLVLDRMKWKRLAGSYHGSGCTLASAIAALLALGIDVISSVRRAQEFTWQSLVHGYTPGCGQSLPNRFFWAQKNDSK